MDLAVGASASERDVRPAASTVIWWAAGTAVTLGPTLASIFTANRSPAFWPSLVALAVAGSVSGLTVQRRPGSPLARRLVALPPSMLVAIGYPVSVGVAISMESAESAVWSDPSATVLYLVVLASLVALGWLCRWGPWWRPATALRIVGWLWIALAILLFPLLGFGLFFVPLAVAYRLAARTLDRMVSS